MKTYALFVLSVCISLVACTSPIRTTKVIPGDSNSTSDQGLYYALPKTQFVVSYTALKTEHRAKMGFFNAYLKLCPKKGKVNEYCTCDIAQQAGSRIAVPTLDPPDGLTACKPYSSSWAIKPGSVMFATRHVPDKNATFYVNIDQGWLGKSSVNLAFRSPLDLASAKSSYTSGAKEAIPIIVGTLAEMITQYIIRDEDEIAKAQAANALRDICGAKRKIAALHSIPTLDKEARAESIKFWSDLETRLSSNFYTTTRTIEEHQIIGEPKPNKLTYPGCMLTSDGPVTEFSANRCPCEFAYKIELTKDDDWSDIVDSVLGHDREDMDSRHLGFRYRIPQRYTAEVSAGKPEEKQLLSRQEVEIAQHGKIVALPEKFGGFQNQVEMVFSRSGALESFLLNAEGTDTKGVLQPISDELTRDRELERAKRDKEYWEALRDADTARDAVLGQDG